MADDENNADDLLDVVTYEFADGATISLNARALREYGADALLLQLGYCDPPVASYPGKKP